MISQREARQQVVLSRYSLGGILQGIPEKLGRLFKNLPSVRYDLWMYLVGRP